MGALTADTTADGRHVVVYDGGAWTLTYRVHHDGEAVVVTGTSDRHPHIVRAVVTGLREEDITVIVERGARDREE